MSDFYVSRIAMGDVGTDPSDPMALAQRLEKLFDMVKAKVPGLSQRQFSEQAFGIGGATKLSSTITNLKAGKASGFKMNVAPRLVATAARYGVLVRDAWLLTGEGPAESPAPLAIVERDPYPNRAAAIKLLRDVFPEQVLEALRELDFSGAAPMTVQDFVDQAKVLRETLIAASGPTKEDSGPPLSDAPPPPTLEEIQKQAASLPPRKNGKRPPK